MSYRRRRLFFLSGDVVPQFVVPSAPAITVTAGENDGELSIDVTALPVSWGDATVPLDGAAAAGQLDWWNSVDGWQLFDASPSTGATVVEVNESLWGLEITIRVRGVSDAGRIGASATDTVTVPGDQFALVDVVDATVLVEDGGVQVQELVEVV